jgi:S-DNA-T family DNA segregation ATPase FtsK/SpoIIIE
VSTTTKNATKADWSLTPGGVASTVTMATGGLAALAGVGEIAHVNPVWGAGVAVAGALGHLAVSAHHAYAPSAIMYRLAAWAGAGSWLAWALSGEHNLFTQPGIISLGAGALVAGIASPLANNTRDGDRPSRALILRSAARAGDEWADRIARVCRVRLKVTNVITWPSGAGYDVHADLPPGGVTRRQIADRAEGLATDARLPKGCGVQVDDGPHRGAIILRVATVNRLAEPITYPADYTARSVLQPVGFGEYPDSSSVEALLRELSVLVSGPRGKGKTTLLQVLTAALLRCRDHLVWHLDLNGGGITQPWIDVWLDGRVRRCPIDWPAPNLPEAKKALRAAIAIAKHRKAAYRKLKRLHNQSLLPISADLPQITLIVDEGAEAVKDQELQKLIGELQNIARNEAVNVVMSSLRPTSDLVPVNMRKQTGVRVQTYGPDEEEMNHMFGWAHRYPMDELAGTGTGRVSIDGAAPRPFRWFNLTPMQIEEIAIAVTDIMPTLDEASAKAAGLDYATRYDRIREYFDDDTEYVDEPEPIAPPSFGRPELTVMNGGRGASGWDALDEVLGRSNAEPITGRHATAELTRAPVQVVPRLLVQALAAFDRAGVERLHSETLAAALGVESTSELPKLLGALEIRPLPEAFYVSGKRARGYARQALAEAADRVARGELEVPDAVAEWPAA